MGKDLNLRLNSDLNSKNREAGILIYCINMVVCGVADEEENLIIWSHFMFFAFSVRSSPGPGRGGRERAGAVIRPVSGTYGC